MTDDNPWLTSLPLTEASVAAQAEVVDSIIRRLERDRVELIETLRGVMGLVQLICHGDGDDRALGNHRYKTAEALLARLEKE